MFFTVEEETIVRGEYTILTRIDYCEIARTLLNGTKIKLIDALSKNGHKKLVVEVSGVGRVKDMPGGHTHMVLGWLKGIFLIENILFESFSSSISEQDIANNFFSTSTLAHINEL